MGARNSRLATRRGLTLVELLVTIVIMVTVLAGVIPLMSPNNNARKIREASRQLNSLIQQAQAQAARDGRPAGIAFQEFSNGTVNSGMSLEAFMIAVPPPFAGFSPDSRVSIVPPGIVYGSLGNGGSLWPKYDGYPVLRLNLSVRGAPDAFPPRMLRIGDTIEIAGNEFLICDDDEPYSMPNALEEVNNVDTGYLLSDPTASVPTPGTTLDCIWLNGNFNPVTKQYRRPLPAASAASTYRMHRQPANTADPPLQFPRGIGIDLQASNSTGPDGRDSFDGGGVNTIGIMFEPNGALEGMYFDNVRSERIDQVFMLLGLFENGNDGSQEFMDYNFDPTDNSGPVDRDTLAQRRTRINWLNADSRWVAINRQGRTVVAANNTSFDPSQSPWIDNLTGTTPRERAEEQKDRQLPAARQYAAEMQSEGGR